MSANVKHVSIVSKISILNHATNFKVKAKNLHLRSIFFVNFYNCISISSRCVSPK